MRMRSPVPGRGGLRMAGPTETAGMIAPLASGACSQGSRAAWMLRPMSYQAAEGVATQDVEQGLGAATASN